MQKRGLLILILLIIPVLLASFAFAASCSDSDGGVNYAAKGTVTAKVPYFGVISGLTRTVRYTDSCQLLPAVTRFTIGRVSQKLYLVEYSCKGDSVVKQTIACPDCKNATCPSAAAAAVAAASYSTLTVTLKNEKGNALGIVVRTMIEGPVSLGAGRTVTLHLKSDPVNVHYSKTTDSSSTAKFTNIPPGEYFLFVSPPAGYKAWSGGNVCPFKLAANESARTDVCLEPGTGTSACYKCPSQTTCKDSDGGLNYYVKGEVPHVEGYNPNIDTCLNSNNVTSYEGPKILEYFCESEGMWNAEIYTCPNGCSNGACLGAPINVTTCTDSDGGANMYRKGVTSGLGWSTDEIVTKEDYCITNGSKAGRLVEYSCYKINGVNRVMDNTFGPEDGCGLCINGVCCREYDTCTQQECTDTDAGINYYIRGVVSQTGHRWADQCIIKGDTTVTTDICSGEDCYLQENFCGFGGMGKDSQFYNCPEGCNYGTCIGTPEVVTGTPPTPIITQTCTDSDKGKNYLVKGSTTIAYSNGTKQTFTDSCNKDGTLKEWYCQDNAALGVNLKCPAGYYCTNGLCRRVFFGGIAGRVIDEVKGLFD